MRVRVRTAAALLAVAVGLGMTVVTPAAAQEREAAPVTWSPDLASGERAGVIVEGSTARLDPAAADRTRRPSGDPPTEGSPGDPVPTGLLILPPHRLSTPTERVVATVVGDLPSGSTAGVDVRGRRRSGAWTEWAQAGTDGDVALVEPTVAVQGRLVLTGSPGAEPVVRGLTFTACPCPLPITGGPPSDGTTEQVPAARYRVFATREGLVGRTTANGHMITGRDQFVALPSRRVLSPRDAGDYSVKVCAPNGRCAFAPVWDVGPWNTRDDYWNPPARRQSWPALPQGVPQAQAAFRNGFNGGVDQFGRTVRNPAGIDLGDGLFWDALRLRDNSVVTVDYLWTGSLPLTMVTSPDGPVPVLSAPRADADVVGTAAVGAGVPVECLLDAGPDRWLRVGVDEFVAATAVAQPGPVGSCDDGDDVGVQPAG